MKYTYCVLAMLCLWASTAQAQNIHPLTVGDTVPDITLHHIINAPFSSSKLSYFKSKLLLLDFMNTTCPSCIAALPKLDSLQDQYKDKVQILIVTPEKEEKVRAFLKKNTIARNISLPFITGDSTLRKLFPHEFIPHIAWINKGKAKAITGSQYVKAGNIDDILHGKAINWSIKREVTGYGYSAALMRLNTVDIPVLSMPGNAYHSAFTSCLPNITKRFGSSIDTTNKLARSYMINLSVVEMYLNTYKLPLLFPISQIIINSPDKGRYFYNPDSAYRDQWMQRNTYSYECVAPLTINPVMLDQKIRNDLDFYFGLKNELVKTKLDCWVLTKSHNETVQYKYFQNYGLASQAGYTNASSLVYLLNHSLYGQPIFDESNLTETQYFFMGDSTVTSIPLLQARLRENGLVLKREPHEVEMLILTETGCN